MKVTALIIIVNYSRYAVIPYFLVSMRVNSWRAVPVLGWRLTDIYIPSSGTERIRDTHLMNKHTYLPTVDSFFRDTGEGR